MYRFYAGKRRECKLRTAETAKLYSKGLRSRENVWKAHPVAANLLRPRNREIASARATGTYSGERPRPGDYIVFDVPAQRQRIAPR